MPSASTQKDWLAKAREVLDIETRGLAAVRDRLDDSFVRALGIMAGCSGRVVITGLGKSGLVGRKIAATLSSTGTPSFFLHPVEGAHGDLGMIRHEDVIVAISNSGETDELNNILPSLRSLAGHVISLTGGTQSTMARLSDVVIDTSVPCEACPHGLAPTASTTATLAVGDALAVCLIEWKSFALDDFRRFHPGGALGQRLTRKVEELMRSSQLPVVPSGASLGQALEVLNAGRLGCVCVLDAGGHLLGLLTDGDVRRLVCANRLVLDAVIDSVMTASPLHATCGQKAAEVLDIMESRAITVLPVVAPDQTLAGMVHMHDVLGQGRVKFSRS
ncbi:arabinose-5-phosphate isomerase [Desulfomicrobium macestii]|uniref:Arabinose-5-phosphate isomerase n=2 Tax=Desulfomicrobium TaxID=898 RepID=A0A8G2C166_DESNO|nr:MULTISPECIES: KpsF/GutQ family sugar-phosphate isomerase [Desulfomicrobium]MBE1425347.1 arabinose-5-phosphate isomerase [Desulfomicrobium macestii]SFL45718.1 arabinose-5-phosphate isomerase [Desulfomicrobium norvegicum]